MGGGVARGRHYCIRMLACRRHCLMSLTKLHAFGVMPAVRTICDAEDRVGAAANAANNMFSILRGTIIVQDAPFPQTAVQATVLRSPPAA
eukprot:2489299-Lingulodinium_polyedra.AAC.1